MGEFVRVARLADLPEGRGMCVEANGRRVALFRLDGEVFAIDDACSHAEASLSEGEVAGGEVVCPLHFATFDIRTGDATGPPAHDDVARYAVRVNADNVEIEV